MTLSFTERLHNGVFQHLDVQKVLFHKKSEYQELVIFETPIFGRVLVLDGVIQTTTKDSFIYHEMISHVGIFSHGSVKRVLIVGGGDGGVLYEVLRHLQIQDVTLVELDSQVISCAKQYLESIHYGSFNDSRANIVIADGFRFLQDTKQDSWDLIIIDSTDPIGPGNVLFSEDFYSLCARALKKDGILITQSGVPFLQRKEFKQSYKRLTQFFESVCFYRASIPSYYGGDMVFGFARNEFFDPFSIPLQPIKQYIEHHNLKFAYYTPEVHQAAFILPAYLGLV